MFTVNNHDIFQTNYVVQGMNTRAKNQLLRTTVNLSCIQKGIFCSSIMTFNSLPPYILKLEQEKAKFMAVSYYSYFFL
jgi:hypothetical protein